jgi:hypothetical protein
MARRLQILHVPDDVHAELSARAEQADLPLNDYLLRELVQLGRRGHNAESQVWSQRPAMAVRVRLRGALAGRSVQGLADAEEVAFAVTEPDGSFAGAG